MKLAIRIIAVTFLTTLLMLGTAIFMRIHTTYDAFENQQRAVAASIVAAMAEPLREAWLAEGANGLDRVLRRENVLSQTVGPQLRWVWFEEGTPAANRPLLPEDRWPSLAHNQPVTMIATAESGGRMLHTYVAVPLLTGRHGGLEVTEPLEPLDQLTWRRFRIDLAALTAVAAACLGVAYATGLMWISRPLNALVRETRRIAEGDFTGSIDVVGRGELRELANALNEMSEKLAWQRATIEAVTEQRIAALQQLRHADRLSTVGRLAAGIAHEMGTPLNVVAGRAALIASGKLTGADVQSSAATIKAEADRIAAIIRNLMDFARQRRLQRSVTDLHALAIRSATLLQEMANRKNVQIEVLPCLGDVQAVVDESQIQQVVINILTNAIDALRQDGMVRMEVSRDASDPSAPPGKPTFARLVVTDNGTGIEESDLEHIFEPFFTTKNVGQGTGLGLSIAYGIIQEHGGRIEVASELGQGTSFTVYLPSEA